MQAQKKHLVWGNQTRFGVLELSVVCHGVQWSPLNSHSKCAKKSCELSEPILCYVPYERQIVVSGASIQIKRGMRISEGQIIRAILYNIVLIRSRRRQSNNTVKNTITIISY